MSRDNGGIIGKDNTPTTNVASGIWSLSEVQEAMVGEIWPVFLSKTPSIDYLLVAGGGGGDLNNFPGSGGPGGAVELANNVAVGSNTYTITVGAGGAEFPGPGYGNGSDGGNTTIVQDVTTLAIARGGDNFGSFQTRTILQSGTIYTGGNTEGGSGSGGNGGAANGGLGRADTTGITNEVAAAGQTVYGILSGSSYYYGGGGGNGDTGLGTHGGGNAGQVGSVNSGGGGGGGTTVAETAADGASGIVIIRYPTTYRAAILTTGSPAYFTYNQKRYYVFSGSGSITF